MNKQEEMWAGKFGDEYTERCSNIFSLRRLFWEDVQKKYKVKRVLEVGCGDGKNLYYIEQIIGTYWGIDVNRTAIEDAKKYTTWANFCLSSATDIPFKNNFFDLVFTCGLLIHIPPDDLLPVMSEMVRCSRKYVMFMEYWAEEEEEIEYRGEMGLLWKRPYKDIFLSSFSRPDKYTDRWVKKYNQEILDIWDEESMTYAQEYKCIDEGFLTKDDGFDDVTWWLFEKK